MRLRGVQAVPPPVFPVRDDLFGVHVRHHGAGARILEELQGLLERRLGSDRRFAGEKCADLGDRRLQSLRGHGGHALPSTKLLSPPTRLSLEL